MTYGVAAVFVPMSAVSLSFKSAWLLFMEDVTGWNYVLS